VQQRLSDFRAFSANATLAMLGKLAVTIVTAGYRTSPNKSGLTVPETVNVPLLFQKTIFSKPSLSLYFMFIIIIL